MGKKAFTTGLYQTQKGLCQAPMQKNRVINLTTQK
jgi:hypothetical protein